MSNWQVVRTDRFKRQDIPEQIILINLKEEAAKEVASTLTTINSFDDDEYRACIMGSIVKDTSWLSRQEQYA